MERFFIFLLILLITLFVQSFFMPLPISDTGTVRYRTLPWMTLTLIVVNSVVFFIFTAPLIYRAESFEEFYPYMVQVYTYGFRAAVLREATSIGAFTTFTSMFMHADLDHLIGNMIYLWTFGRRLEDACGSWRFLLFYLCAGMVANLGSVVVSPGMADVPSRGASGAISGVLGAFLILFPGVWVRCLWGLGSVVRVPYALIMGKPFWAWTIKLPAWLLLIAFAVMNIIPSFETIRNQQEVVGVNYLAHMMGFLGSLAIFFFVRKDLLMRYFAGRSL